MWGLLFTFALLGETLNKMPFLLLGSPLMLFFLLFGLFSMAVTPQLWGVRYGESSPGGGVGPTAVCAVSSMSAATPRSQLLWVWSVALKGRLQRGRSWLMAAGSHLALSPPPLLRNAG